MTSEKEIKQIVGQYTDLTFTNKTTFPTVVTDTGLPEEICLRGVDGKASQTLIIRSNGAVEKFYTEHNDWGAKYVEPYLPNSDRAKKALAVVFRFAQKYCDYHTQSRVLSVVKRHNPDFHP